MGNLRILMHSYDIGPSKNLFLIADYLAGRGCNILALLNQSVNKISVLNKDFDCLITGLSSFDKNKEELVLGHRAKIIGIPWLVVADTHKSWARPNARGKVSNAVLLAPTKREVKDAKTFGYGEVFYVGGPPLWQNFNKLKQVRLDRQANEKIIMIAGMKDAFITNAMLECAVRAMNLTGSPWRLIFKPHPNEIGGPRDDEKRICILREVSIIETKIDINNLLDAVDLVVFTSGGTTGIAAAYRRRPVVYFESDAVRERMLQQTGFSCWYPAEAGACLKAGPDAEGMKSGILKLFSLKGQSFLRERQEEIYPNLAKSQRVEEKILRVIKKQTKG